MGKKAKPLHSEYIPDRIKPDLFRETLARLRGNIDKFHKAVDVIETCISEKADCLHESQKLVLLATNTLREADAILSYSQEWSASLKPKPTLPNNEGQSIFLLNASPRGKGNGQFGGSKHRRG